MHKNPWLKMTKIREYLLGADLQLVRVGNPFPSAKYFNPFAHVWTRDRIQLYTFGNKERAFLLRVNKTTGNCYEIYENHRLLHWCGSQAEVILWIKRNSSREYMYNNNKWVTIWHIQEQ